MKKKHSVQVIAITGGKGGTGKSTLAINLSIALATLGQRVALLDGNLELPCIDTLLNIRPQRTLSNLIEGNCTLTEILHTGPRGINLILGSPYSKTMHGLLTAHHVGIINAFNEIQTEVDVLVVDTASGANDSVLNFTHAAHEVLVVICNEPASILNAHALIYTLNNQYKIRKFRVISNRTYSPMEGRDAFSKLLALTSCNVDLSLMYVGNLPEDLAVRYAAHKRRAVYEISPRSKFSRELEAIAKKISRWPLHTTPRGHIEFFMDSLIMAPSGHGIKTPG
ncbi:MinD/ParA family ATP-binding protein [Pseudomonas helleri]|uniref:MinD/ParA family ATP-binding protein n=1 Tax=Pseudomonas helleri TaxID=1608996 RepID=UPI003825F7D3